MILFLSLSNDLHMRRLMIYVHDILFDKLRLIESALISVIHCYHYLHILSCLFTLLFTFVSNCVHYRVGSKCIQNTPIRQDESYLHYYTVRV